MNKIGIVGCGWLGLPLAKAFTEKGYAVNGSTTSEEKIRTLKEIGIQPFLFSLPSNSISVKGCVNVDYLIINIPPGRKHPEVAKIFPLKIESILGQVPNHTKILFVSSTSVYGNMEGEVDEKTVPLPSTESGKALFEVEKKLMVISPKGNNHWIDRCAVIRLSGLVGPGRIPGRFFAGKSNIPAGDAPVNLVHLEDCIRFISEIIVQEKWGRIYNLSTDHHPTKRKFYTKACNDAKLDAPSFLPGGQTMKLINSDKIKTELGLKLNHPDPMNFAF